MIEAKSEEFKCGEFTHPSAISENTKPSDTNLTATANQRQRLKQQQINNNMLKKHTKPMITTTSTPTMNNTNGDKS